MYPDCDDCASAAQLLGARCPALEDVSALVLGELGYEAEDIVTVLSTCSRVTRLTMEASSVEYRSYGDSDDDSDDDGLSRDSVTFRISLFKSFVRAGGFRSLVVLSLGLIVRDSHARVMAGQLPCLRAFYLWWPAYIIPDMDELLSPWGVSTLINGVPSLSVLTIATSPAVDEPFPPCRPGIRRLGLIGTCLTDHALKSLLRSVGSDLLSLSLFASEDITNASVKAIADHCPKLESLNINACDLITPVPACLSSLAQLSCLRELELRYPAKFTDKHMDWLEQHTQAPAIRDLRRFLRQSRKEKLALYDVAAFGSCLRAEGIPH